MVRCKGRERGAALITVLLFVVLMFILITAMLTVTGNEIVIAGLQRDGVRATELAQAGIQEAIRRVEAGRPYSWPFTSSLDSRVSVTVTRVYPGTNSAYLQIDATASNIGRATRRLTALVLQEVVAFPPDVTFANSVTEQGSASISCGDAYSQTFLQYHDYPSNSCGGPATLTYTGWRVSKVNPGAVAACYTHLGCVAANPGNTNVANWYPGIRQTTPETSTDGRDLQAFKNNAEANSCVATILPYTTAVLPAGARLQTDPESGPATGGGLPQYGFDTDTPAGRPSQLDPDLFPCGLPYKWISETVYDESGLPLSGGVPPGERWFKTIIFEEWFQNYWRFDDTQMTQVKRAGGACVDGICVKNNVGDPSPTVQPNLVAYPQFGAVPPFPDMTSVSNNYDCQRTGGGGVINSLPMPCTRPDGSSTTSDLGCKNPEMAGCAASRQVDFVLTCNPSPCTWQLNGNIGGHGTLIVNGDLVVNGTFTYWGTIVVNGTLQAGTGNVIVYGGLIAQDTLRLIGNITVNGGGTVANVPTGNSLVFGRAWWEH